MIRRSLATKIAIRNIVELMRADLKVQNEFWHINPITGLKLTLEDQICVERAAMAFLDQLERRADSFEDRLMIAVIPPPRGLHASANCRVCDGQLPKGRSIVCSHRCQQIDEQSKRAERRARGHIEKKRLPKKVR